MTSAKLIDKGGYDCTSNIFALVAAGREKDLTPPRVLGDKPSSSTSSARGTLRRPGVKWEKRGDDGEDTLFKRPPGVWVKFLKVVPKGGGGTAERGHLCVGGGVCREGNDGSSETAGGPGMPMVG